MQTAEEELQSYGTMTETQQKTAPSGSLDKPESRSLAHSENPDLLHCVRSNRKSVTKDLHQSNGLRVCDQLTIDVLQWDLRSKPYSVQIK